MTSERNVAYIRILSGPNKGGVYVLRDHSVYAIGSSEDCLVRVDEGGVEPRHCWIDHDRSNWHFRATEGSEHPCFVNDIPTCSRALVGGEILRIGGQIELFFTFNKPQQRPLSFADEVPSEVNSINELPQVSCETVEVDRGRKIREEVSESPTSAGVRSGSSEPKQQEAPSCMRLVVVDGDPRDIGKEFVLPLSGEVFVGRSPDCGLHLHDKKMSRVHCQIERDGDRYRVTDLSSLNGTVVNGLRAASALFGLGDYFRLGFTVVAVQKVREVAH